VSIRTRNKTPEVIWPILIPPPPPTPMVLKKIQKSPVLIYIIPMILQRKLEEPVLILYPRSQIFITVGSSLVLNEVFEIIRTAS
jgi:hypothetical protein